MSGRETGESAGMGDVAAQVSNAVAVRDKSFASGARASKPSRWCRTGVLLAFLLLAFSVAAVSPQDFRDRAEEVRFQDLVRELRCLVCQNQNLADSDAGLAQDLRNEVLEMMRAGKTDAQIREFLVARYGEFVLYRPPVQPTTWLLWFGPAAVLLAGLVVIVRIVRKRSRALPGEARGEEDLP